MRAVVFDLDGTLLDEAREISEFNRQVISKLRSRGVDIFLASGRTYLSMLPYYRSLGLDTPLISYNGAKIVYPDGEVVESGLAPKMVDHLIQLSRSLQVHLNLYHDEVWYTEYPQSAEAFKYAETSGLAPVVPNFDLIMKSGITKALFIAPPERLHDVKLAVAQRLGDMVSVTSSMRSFLEILKRGVNKGQALREVLSRYGIALADVIAFGDGLNDLEMLQSVGLGVAMDNAYEELKSVADDIAPHHNQGGVGVYLQRLLDSRDVR